MLLSEEQRGSTLVKLTDDEGALRLVAVLAFGLGAAAFLAAGLVAGVFFVGIDLVVAPLGRPGAAFLGAVDVLALALVAVGEVFR